MSGEIRRITVAGARPYPVWVGRGLLAERALIEPKLTGRQVLLVSNETVAPLYADRLAWLAGSRRFALEVLPDGEGHKTLASAERLFAALAALGAQRDAVILALGGGVVGDLAGFAAALWMRGIDWIALPTTLLAQVDAAIGGKTAVNLPAGKNLVGAFHPPRAVLCDLETLATLPEREYRAGLAEVVKYACIADAGFFAWLEGHAEPLLGRDPAVLAEAVARSVAHKAAIVGRDEREQGERALLNFGHTFGHALEAAGEYRTWLHGEAVAIGMRLAARLAERLGLAEAGDTARLDALLARLGLGASAAMPSADALLGFIRLDKKGRSDRLRFVLWRGVGRALVAEGVPEETVRAVLAAPL
ncbi:MAG: 3-dehydroquinate synthase [Xanthomonadales bacterium]|nr:3-dehydroquinate synthase [Xanthomonadales bacterium]